VLEMVVPANSPSIIESKSLKLYLNSFKGTQFSNVLEVRQTLESDLSQAGRPKELSVYARFTRRGGIDINPYRTTSKDSIDNLRLVRQ
jgi:7-cyano-7-deazaguanine reductase